jgi:hypothetical protein
MTIDEAETVQEKLKRLDTSEKLADICILKVLKRQAIRG